MSFRILTAGVVPTLLIIACNSGAPPTGAAGAGQTDQSATAPSASPPSAAPQTATPAVAQPATTPTSANDPATARTPVSGRDDNTGPLTEGQIAAITDGVNKGEIEQAKIARSKSKNKDVLAFASMMIAHHGQATKQLAALKETPETSPLAIQMEGNAQSTLARLNQANGADFDRAYLEAQVQGHQEALDTLRQKLLPSATSPALTKYLKGLQPKIEQHLERATQLRDQFASAQGEHAGAPPPNPSTSADAKSSQLKRVQQPDEAKHHTNGEQTSSSPPATGKR